MTSEAAGGMSGAWEEKEENGVRAWAEEDLLSKPA